MEHFCISSCRQGSISSLSNPEIPQYLALLMLRLLTPKAQGGKDFWKSSKPCHVGFHLIDSSHWVLSDEYPYARVPVIFQGFLHHFVLAKLATSSIRVNSFGRQCKTTRQYEHSPTHLCLYHPRLSLATLVIYLSEASFEIIYRRNHKNSPGFLASRDAWISWHNDINKQGGSRNKTQEKIRWWGKMRDSLMPLNLSMLRLLSSKAKGCKDFWKSSKPCHVGIHWKALAEYFQMSTHLPRFQLFFRIFA